MIRPVAIGSTLDRLGNPIRQIAISPSRRCLTLARFTKWRKLPKRVRCKLPGFPGIPGIGSSRFSTVSNKSLKYHIIFAIAPMIDWTDRHCRFFHRQLTRHALLYTEMIVADAILHGDREKLLGFDDCEHPVALQLGGSNPGKLAQAARIGAEFGYDEINLNVGCPSDRVQSGTFGACLMRTPKLVGECVAAMKGNVSVPVTVKCRIGVDDQDPEEALPALAEAVWAAGADALWVHARKAWLEGLSPKQNREVPPLDYALVSRIKQENPNRFIGLNGGIENLNQVRKAIGSNGFALDGAMMGRAAYQNPQLLREVDQALFGDPSLPVEWAALIATMQGYAADHIDAGGRLHQVTRHMVGLFHGLPGARKWRQILSVEGVKPGARPEVIAEAFDAVNLDAVDAAA